MEELIFKSIGSIGFPIAACIWMALFGKKSLDENTKSNNNLAISMDNLAKATDKHSSQLEHIDNNLIHIENKIDHLAELFIEFKSKKVEY